MNSLICIKVCQYTIASFDKVLANRKCNERVVGIVPLDVEIGEAALLALSR
jgi:hypothetical protein